MQLTIFLLWGLFQKGIICILGGIFKSLSLLEGMRDFKNTIKPPFLSVISSLYGKWTTTNWLLEKDLSNFVVSAMHKISIFPSTILSKPPNVFLMELIFRYEKITLLRCECPKRFKVTLNFSSYSELVVDASMKEAPFTCSIYLVLQFHTFLQNTYNIFCKNAISCFIQVQFILS